MKNNLMYFAFATLIIACIGFTSVWKKNTKTNIQETLNTQIIDDSILTSDLNKEIKIPTDTDLNTIDNNSVSYKDGYPILTHLIGFGEAFTKARTLNADNFWYNEGLYHTNVKKDPIDSKEENPLNNTDKQNILTQIP